MAEKLVRTENKRSKTEVASAAVRLISKAKNALNSIPEFRNAAVNSFWAKEENRAAQFNKNGAHYFVSHLIDEVGAEHLDIWRDVLGKRTILESDRIFLSTGGEKRILGPRVEYRHGKTKDENTPVAIKDITKFIEEKLR